MIDTDLLASLVDYNIYRRSCFKHGIVPIFEDVDFERILKARYNKVSRVRKRLVYLISHFKYCYFITFTFDEDYINLSSRSKKDLIKKSLNSFSDDVKYILNIDFGDNTEREHYHCILGTNNSSNFFKHIKQSYPFFTWVEKIYIEQDSLKRLSKYINKLSNHTVKDSTKSHRVIYNFKGYDVLDPYLAKLVYFHDCKRVGL